MMKNQRLFESRQVIETFIDDNKDDSSIVWLFLKGAEIATADDYYRKILLATPHRYAKKNSVDQLVEEFKEWMRRYDDFLTDQEVYVGSGDEGKNTVVLIIDSYQDFLKDVPEFKSNVEYVFDEIVLPFYEEESETCVVGGMRLSYTVYCCDDTIRNFPYTEAPK